MPGVLARYPSKLSLPQDCSGLDTVLDHLVTRFPNVSRERWRRRMADGHVHWHDGTPVTPESRCRPQQRVYYFREVASEPAIPFRERILFEDEHLLLADKPHFLPVTPGGLHVNECLQTRLRMATGCDTLQALHRLDRVTAGLVLFSKTPATRARYHELFRSHRIEKTYHGVADVGADVGAGGPRPGDRWEVRNRLDKGGSRYRMRVTPGLRNAHSVIRCLQRAHGRALFELRPVTGRTHQLRVHMQELGWPLRNDMLYPRVQPHDPHCLARPLQLLARRLRFTDPLTGAPRDFVSERELAFP